jgi:hypothetical protein
VRRAALVLVAAAFVVAGCADDRANGPPATHHLRPTSNQNPDTEAH